MAENPSWSTIPTTCWLTTGADMAAAQLLRPSTLLKQIYMTLHYRVSGHSFGAGNDNDYNYDVINQEGNDFSASHLFKFDRRALELDIDRNTLVLDACHRC
ncbi:MAG: hypothetical protein J3Q66DRAFT_397073 [Benniella sp.]|nr:MAG: hypothetical protein J3Q66DRAFT_397073 [Benniella sp.]